MDPNERVEGNQDGEDEGNNNNGNGDVNAGGGAELPPEGDRIAPDEGIVDGNEIVENDNNDEMPYENWALRPPDEPLPDNVLNVMAQVFQNDMLVENILEKIILDNDRPSIRSCRLVSKQWLCAIAKLYRKMKRPQFIVNTNKDNALLNEPRPRPFFEQHTLLYEFIKPMARHDRIEGFIPTFSLTLGASYFRKSNYTDFVNCLVQCGPSLVELYIRFPKNSAMSFLLPPSITLPNLNTFGVAFSGQSLFGQHFPMAYHHQHDYFPNNCSIHLVQTILNASSNLRRIQFMSCPNPMNPPDMENLYLPDSLTSIHIDTPFRDFELFLRKGLPYLTEIRINATIALYSEETIYDLFSKLCPTLRTVWLTGSAGTRRSLPIRFPRMEHLTKFVMFKPWEFEERNPPTSFEETFPALETLVFANQTEYSFSYLMSGMRSTTVTSFCVWLTSLRPHPPVMNFPPLGLPVGEDQPRPPQPHIHLHEPMQERRERMRHALQQMRLDIMERHHRRIRAQPIGGGVAAADIAEELIPLYPPLGVDPPVARRVVLMNRRGGIGGEERDGGGGGNNNNNNNNDDIDVIRVVHNNVEIDPQLPQFLNAPRRWNRGVDQMEQERYRFLAQRARIAWEYRQRLRERQGQDPPPVGAHGLPPRGIDGGARDEIIPGPIREPARRPIQHPFDIGHVRPPHYAGPGGPNIAGVHVVIERVRPPLANVHDVMNQPPRVVIRRLEDRAWGGPPAAYPPEINPPPPPPQRNPAVVRPVVVVHAGQNNNNNNEAPVVAAARAVPVLRPEEQNPIRAVYQHMLDRMEVDREEVDNAIHRESESEEENENDDSDDDVEGAEGMLHRLGGVIERLRAVNNADNEERDGDDGGVAVGGLMVRRLEALAAAAVAQQQEQAGENNQEDVPPPPPPPQQEQQPPEQDEQREEAGGQPAGLNLMNAAVQEAFRVIREENFYELPPELPPPVVRLGPPVRREADGEAAQAAAAGANAQPAGGRPPAANGGVGVRRRLRHELRQQEARNLRDLRQLRHRMLLDWANPRGPRLAPGGGGAAAAGVGGPHVPLPERPVTMTKEKMQSINLAFPNLVKLTINISGPETCGLKYIFEEMRSLQSLRIIVENSLWTIKWDSLLTGIPQDFCDAVRSSAEIWDEVYLNENHVSIRNLTKLEELMLLECVKVDEHRDQHRTLDEHYISDVAFHFGLLKMKELKHLTVTPGFTPSPAMYKKWYEEKGYKIKARPRARLDVSYYEYH